MLGLLAASGYLTFQRGGVLAWSGVAFASLLWLKHLFRPSRKDFLLSLGFTLLWVAMWGLTWAYVRSAWESGEVVEIGVEVSGEVHNARVWVLDLDGEPLMYYDSPPRVGQALLAHAPMSFSRGDETIAGCADATRVDELPEEDVAALLSLMEEKYQENNHATDVFYVMLGGERDRIGLVLRIEACS